MTVISTVFDGYVSLIAGLLPTYAKIPNGYNIEDNAAVFHRLGFAIAFSSGRPTNRQIQCKYSEARSFDVSLVAQVTAAVTDFDAFNLLVKNLFEDRFKIIKSIENNPGAVAGAVNTVVVGDPAIRFLEGDKAKYFVLTTTFESEYFQDLTA